MLPRRFRQTTWSLVMLIRLTNGKLVIQVLTMISAARAFPSLGAALTLY